ncbi:MAG: NADH-quinone oxidoreductase subunit NuoK [Oligoflexales bacterium]
MVPIEHYLILACLLFTIGVIGVLVRKNIFFILMSIQLILNATNLVFIAASRHIGNLDGEVFMIFIIAIASCQAAVGLSIVISLFRQYRSINSDFFKILRG